jgi:CBS domain-containing protein
MSVASILNQKGRAVITISESDSLRVAVQLLAQHRIGAVVIVEGDGSVKGILSERDIVRAVAGAGGAALDSPVSAHMTKRVITCTADSSIHQVMETMTAGKFRHVPVTVDGRLDGMISIGDVVKYRLAQLEHESASLRQYIAAG